MPDDDNLELQLVEEIQVGMWVDRDKHRIFFRYYDTYSGDFELISCHLCPICEEPINAVWKLNLKGDRLNHEILKKLLKDIKEERHLITYTDNTQGFISRHKSDSGMILSHRGHTDKHPKYIKIFEWKKEEIYIYKYYDMFFFPLLNSVQVANVLLSKIFFSENKTFVRDEVLANEIMNKLIDCGIIVRIKDLCSGGSFTENDIIGFNNGLFESYKELEEVSFVIDTIGMPHDTPTDLEKSRRIVILWSMVRIETLLKIEYPPHLLKIINQLNGAELLISPNKNIVSSNTTEISKNPRHEMLIIKNPSNPKGTALKIFEIFHEKKPTKITDIVEYDEPKKDNSEIVGDMIQIDYISDKWHDDGEKVYYYHECEENFPKLARNKKDKTQYYVFGEQPVKPEGIIVAPNPDSIGKIPPTPSHVAYLGELAQLIYKRDGKKYSVKPHGYLLCASGEGKYIYFVKKSNLGEENPIK